MSENVSDKGKVSVKVFRNAYEHLLRIANYDYSSCCNSSELTSWQFIAIRFRDELNSLCCSRANERDLEWAEKAINKVNDLLVRSKERIVEYERRSM